MSTPDVRQAPLPHALGRPEAGGHEVNIPAKPALPAVQIVEVLPTSIWIESDFTGDRRVMLQHEGMEPFAYATFHYSYGYTDNAGTFAAAEGLARALGAVDPIEHRRTPMPAGIVATVAKARTVPRKRVGRDQIMLLAEQAGVAPNTILHWETAFLRFASLLESAVLAAAVAEVRGVPGGLTEMMRHVRRVQAHVQDWWAWYGDADVLLRNQLPLPPSRSPQILEDLDAAIAAATPSPAEPAMPAERVALSEEQIDSLRGLDTDRRVRFYEHDFYVLSNFSAFSIVWDGRRFDTSEHLYHYLKFNTTAHDVADAIFGARSAHEAFKLAERNKGARRKDWDAVKVELMRDILRLTVKQHEYVRRKLLATGDRELVEDSWRDDFWGWGPNRDGRNMLGKLWMEVRAELRGITPAQGKGEQG